jgi:hypothetical protein
MDGITNICQLNLPYRPICRSCAACEGIQWRRTREQAIFSERDVKYVTCFEAYTLYFIFVYISLRSVFI